MDAPLYAKSGHQGTAMALAPLAHVLFSRVMRYDPANPSWPDRDRFILSNGHASILQYSMLYLAGFGLEIDDIKGFRQWGSLTPGHPEARHTVGIEVTPTLTIPNAFTPNGDGLNDVLEVKGRFLGNYTFVVVDRNGQEVFRGTQRSDVWDGRIAGHAPVLGSYVWRFQQTSDDGQPFVRSGTVTILK